MVTVTVYTSLEIPSIKFCSIFSKIWDIKSEKCETELEFPVKSFEITALAHPPTYKDKILFGSRQGSLQVLQQPMKSLKVQNSRL
jgi:hypothetical protein